MEELEYFNSTIEVELSTIKNGIYWIKIEYQFKDCEISKIDYPYQLNKKWG